jgi:hypothetical protein
MSIDGGNGTLQQLAGRAARPINPILADGSPERRKVEGWN